MHWGVLLLVAVSMMVKDLTSSAAVALISRGRGFLAGLFDTLSDVATTLSIGVTAVVTVANGFSTETVLAFLFMGVGSIFGTIVGTKIGHRVSVDE